MLDLEPLLRPFPIDDLRPTQITVGYREVDRKRHAWRQRAESDGPEFLGQHMIPVVLGPKDRAWMIDNHHLARALHDEGVGAVLVRVVADLRGLHGRQFRTFMDNRNWFHPFDAGGHRRPIARIPKHVSGLVDDPYRSLAGELRRAGGYAKDITPYSEFLWADFLRRHIDAERIGKHFESAIQDAIEIAHRREAAYLPGWAGPHD